VLYIYIYIQQSFFAHIICKFEKICDMFSLCYFAFLNQRVKEKGDKYAGRLCLFVRYPDLVFDMILL
jgi:hypothetical protein